ncbi:hypothetical protein N181_23340 [Sinorhizobium fredii USDA 205]|uniref:Uncharacterized protein n=1 Tax=Rhizobium fredii TaxID=380 RepID=A0A844A3V4_RHIFR|nr:hypothetical protein [Sinorhizobium fredii]KSV85594.1 hypothetical protein N181_23340 [Sinorhizobium fredii USDA 205]MQX06772.1 hypothetical protein [Sinorhizobium fredii]GEC34056.1 hypothetical protein EFR01_42270 [Sinorhizobium fredii]GLS06405.1 hypothetical protein GCM10007864_00290 [Sinorhizobium fredii]
MSTTVVIKASEVTRLVEVFAQAAADLVDHVTESFGPDHILPRAHLSMWVEETVGGDVLANLTLGDPDDITQPDAVPPEGLPSVLYRVADAGSSTARDVVHALRSPEFRAVLADRELIGKMLGHARYAAFLGSDQAEEIAA